MSSNVCESADLSIGKVCFFRFGIENNYITSGDRQFLAMRTSVSQVGNRKFQGLETEVPCHPKSLLSEVYAGVIFALAHMYIMLRCGLYSCKHASCYTADSTLALAHMSHVSSWDLPLLSHKCVILRCGIVPCTCIHTSWYVVEYFFAFAHMYAMFYFSR